MPFPKEAQRKGGRSPASDKQKAIARQTIQQIRPWERSTGPRSQMGKALSSRNRVKLDNFVFHRVIRSWEVDDFWGECAVAEQAIAALQAVQQKFQVSGKRVRLSIKFNITRQSGDEEENCWAIYFCRLAAIHSLVSSGYHWQSSSGLPFPDSIDSSLEEWMERRFDEAIAEIEQIIKRGSQGYNPES